jgi:polysaccharide pyruvyl transferase WcaK-like protein
MKKVLLYGYFGFNNFGDEWLLNTTLKLFTIFSEKKEFFVLYNIKEKIKVVDKNVVYIPRWNIIEILKSVFQVDTVVSIGGLFQDKTSVSSLMYYLLILIFAKILNKKVFVLNTELDIKKLPKSFVVFLLNFFTDGILVRNKVDLKISKKTKFCPDICLYNFDEKQVDIEKKEIRTVGIVVKQTTNFVLLSEMCEVLSKQYKLVFIPFHIKEDYPFCLKLCERLTSCEIRVWDRIENYKNMFADIDLIITSRLHGIILAGVLCKPFICISEEEKIKKMIKTTFELQPVSLFLWKQKRFCITEENLFYPKIDKIKEYKDLVLKRFYDLV